MENQKANATSPRAWKEVQTLWLSERLGPTVTPVVEVDPLVPDLNQFNLD